MDVNKRNSGSSSGIGITNSNRGANPGGIMGRSEWHQQELAKRKEQGAIQSAELRRAAMQKAKEDSLKGKYYGRRGGPIPADTRYAKVLASVYDDPFMKMLIQAGAIAPASY